jgi:hypothetical protein
MRTIFDGLVEEFRAWHLFEQQAGNSPQRELAELPGLDLPDYGAGSYDANGYRGPGYGPSGWGAADAGTPEYPVPEYPVPEYPVPEYGARGTKPGHGGAHHDRAPRYAPAHTAPGWVQTHPESGSAPSRANPARRPTMTG